MKHVTVALLALALVACSKEDVRLNVRLTATCRMCAIEYTNLDGAVVRDTVIGLLKYQWSDGVATVDTIPAHATWNTVRFDGDELMFRACKLTNDTMFPEVLVTASGDIESIYANNDGAQCALLGGLVRHQ